MVEQEDTSVSKTEAPSEREGSSPSLGTILQVLEPLSEFEREEVFEGIRGEYCIYCGRVPPKYGCQCTNDL